MRVLFAISSLLFCQAALYGTELMENSPARSGLVMIDEENGNVTKIGQIFSQESCTGDLRAIDSKRNVFYFLGDAHGPALVALNLTDGTVVCSKTVPQFKEIEFVGFGQSLDYDYINEELVLTGISSKPNTTTHIILRMSTATNTCDDFHTEGTFGLADYVPMLHSRCIVVVVAICLPISITHQFR